MDAGTIFAATGAIGGFLGGIAGLAALWYARQSARASEVSAQAAREAVNHQKAVELAQNRASLVRRSMSQPDENIPWSRRHGGQGTLGVRLFNEGPAPARDVQIMVTLQDGTVLGPTEPITIRPEVEMSPAVDIHQFQFGAGTERLVKYMVTYRDGTGPQQMMFWIRIVGEWEDHWKIYLEPAP